MWPLSGVVTLAPPLKVATFKPPSNGALSCVPQRGTLISTNVTLHSLIQFTRANHGWIAFFTSFASFFVWTSSDTNQESYTTFPMKEGFWRVMLHFCDMISIVYLFGLIRNSGSVFLTLRGYFSIPQMSRLDAYELR